jgi:hypothetical protein
MKLWIGGELEASVADAFRTARISVETAINNLIEGIDASEANDWDVIAILRDDEVYGERVRFSKKDGMDLRLKIPFNEFLQASPDIQKTLIIDMLLRSLEIIGTKYPSAAIEQVIAAVRGVKNGA